MPNSPEHVSSNENPDKGDKAAAVKSNAPKTFETDVNEAPKNPIVKPILQAIKANESALKSAQDASKEQLKASVLGSVSKLDLTSPDKVENDILTGKPLFPKVEAKPPVLARNPILDEKW